MSYALNIKKHQLTLLALSASLGLSACGKKTELYSGKGDASATQEQNKTKPTAPQAPSTNSTNDGETRFTNGQLPTQAPSSSDRQPSGPNGDNSTPWSNNNPGPTLGGSITPMPNTSNSTSSEQPRVQNSDSKKYDPLNPRSVDQPVWTKQTTGATNNEGLLYTGSSTDSIHAFLRSRNHRVDAATRQQNVAAASAVVKAKISFDSSTQNIAVSLQMTEGKSLVVYNLATQRASSQEGGLVQPASKLTSVASANGLISSGSRNIEGTLKCLDMDGGCENIFVRLKIGGKGSPSAIFNVIFRNTLADTFIHIPKDNSNNSEYLWMKDFLRNSFLHDHNRNVQNRIETVIFSSWEVVHGRSGFELYVKGANKELLGFAGPLLAPPAGSAVNISLSRLNKMDSSDDFTSSDAISLKYANTISDARLIANNGQGQLKLKFYMRQKTTAKQDRFYITFMRQIKPIIELNDANLE
ncbi:MAG: hypothetical protein ACOYOK_08035 [Pseudobdellovibrionaceae bacterium]